MHQQSPSYRSEAPLAQFGLIAVPALSVLILAFRSIWDGDIFWQLRLGELILSAGYPIASEPFSATHFNEPMPSLAWAGQAIYAGVRAIGGWSLLRVCDALIWLGGFWAAGYAAYRRGSSSGGVALALMLGLVAALPVASLRPQSFAALCFGLTVLLAGNSVRPALRLAIGGVLFVAWQNLHPSVPVAAVWLGLVAMVQGLGPRAVRQRSEAWVTAGLAAIAALAVFATPDGAQILSVSAVNSAQSRAVGISEWLPLWAPANRLEAVPIAVVAGLAAWMMVRRRAHCPAEWVPAAALFVLMLFSYRFVLFWAIAMVPVHARAASVPARRVVPRGPLLVVMSCAVLAALATPTRFDAKFPMHALEQLRRSGAEGTIFARSAWGGMLVDSGHPRWRVAIDGRIYRYTHEDWRIYAATRTQTGLLPVIEQRWRPVAYLLDRRLNAGLVADLQAMPRQWREVPTRDRRAALFVPGHVALP